MSRKEKDDDYRRKNAAQPSASVYGNGHYGSFVPLGTQAGKDAEDRSPDLHLFQPPSQKRSLAAHLQWFLWYFPRSGKNQAEFLPVPVTQHDGTEARGAHSCGAVADFHRLPEHPDDCCYGVRCFINRAACISW